MSKLPPSPIEGQQQFRDAIQAIGLNAPAQILADGKLHRFASDGKRGDDSGWYVLHTDGIPAGAFGCWRTGVSESWRADVGRTLSPDEEASHRARVEAMRRQREAEEIRRRAAAKDRAAQIWNQSHIAPAENPYLIRKGIKPHGVRIHDGALVIPMHDATGEINSMQFIDGDGNKRFLAGGRVAGCFFTLGDPARGPLCIAEGFATGATIHEGTGYPVAVAFNAGNLESVARALREKFPDGELVLCADDDAATAGNPGLTKAKAAALAVGGKLAAPDFGADRPDGVSDFNDLAQCRGAEAVKIQIESATLEAPKSDDPINAVLEAAGIAELQAGANLAAVESAVRALATMLGGADDIRRATVGEAALKKLAEIGISAPGRLLDAAMPKGSRNADDIQGKPLLLRQIEPHAEPTDGAQMLIDVCRAIRRHVVADNADVAAMSLWCVHAHAIDAFGISPFLNLSSPEKGCGKSTTLTVLSYLLPCPLLSGSVSPASIFRAIELYKPSFLIDEADTFQNLHEELRGLLNASHLRASSQVIRTVGDDHEPRAFSTWCPKAIALIGRLPDTLDDRSIVVSMRRRRRGEVCERFSAIDPHPELELLGQKIARWVTDNFDRLRQAKPDAEGIDLRLYDNWMPLLAVADTAGGPWPGWARIAASQFVAKATDSVSIKVELLADAAEIMGDDDRMSSEQLVDALNALADRPWPTFSRGKPITQLHVSRMFKAFESKPANIRVADKVVKGYHRGDIVAALTRYISPLEPLQPLQKKLANEIKELEAIFVAALPATKEESIFSTRYKADPATKEDPWETIP